MYFYLIYQITNVLNGKIYIGQHKTKNPDDSYFGSGLALRKAIKKHGIENFEKRILHFARNAEELDELERSIVNEEFCRRPDTYNMIVGGDVLKQNDGSDTHRQRCKAGYKKMISSLTKKGICLSDVSKRGRAASLDARKKHKRGVVHDPALRAKFNFAESKLLQAECMRKAVSPEAQAKKRATLKRIEHQRGAKNSQFGTAWMTNGERTVKVSVEEVASYEKEGYRRGRTLKHPAF